MPKKVKIFLCFVLMLVAVSAAWIYTAEQNCQGYFYSIASDENGVDYMICIPIPANEWPIPQEVLNWLEINDFEYRELRCEDQALNARLADMGNTIVRVSCRNNIITGIGQPIIRR